MIGSGSPGYRGDMRDCIARVPHLARKLACVVLFVSGCATGPGAEGAEGSETQAATGTDESLECMVGEGVVLSSTVTGINWFEKEQPFSEVCSLDSLENGGPGPFGGQTFELVFDCVGEDPLQVRVTSDPVWTPPFEPGDSFRLELPLPSDFGDETVWRLYDPDTDALLVDYVDSNWIYDASLDVTRVSGLCEPEGYCEGEMGLPTRQDIALDFNLEGETLRLFGGHSGDLGPFTIHVATAETNECQASGDAPGGRYKYLAVRL